MRVIKATESKVIPHHLFGTALLIATLCRDKPENDKPGGNPSEIFFASVTKLAKSLGITKRVARIHLAELITGTSRRRTDTATNNERPVLLRILAPDDERRAAFSKRIAQRPMYDFRPEGFNKLEIVAEGSRLELEAVEATRGSDS